MNRGWRGPRTTPRGLVPSASIYGTVRIEEVQLNNIRAIAACLVLSLAAFAACSRPPAASAVPAAQPAPMAAPAGQAAGETVSGPVLETMNAATYTYIRVRTDRGEIWAASIQFPVAVGDRVVFPLETPMSNFHSQSLNRDFPLI